MFTSVAIADSFVLKAVWNSVSFAVMSEEIAFILSEIVEAIDVNFVVTSVEIAVSFVLKAVLNSCSFVVK